MKGKKLELMQDIQGIMKNYKKGVMDKCTELEL